MVGRLSRSVAVTPTGRGLLYREQLVGAMADIVMNWDTPNLFVLDGICRFVRFGLSV